VSVPPQETPQDTDAALERARAIARAVRSAGGRAFVVGGSVRDHLLGHGRKDLDLEVYGLPAPALKAELERFGPVHTVGESFTVYKLGDIDVALPRRESKSGRGHRGFEVQGDPFMPVEDAARRRDFTVNAILWDPLTGQYVDPFGGRGDLAARRLKAVDRRTFGEDSLRVLRAVQFAARFELSITPETAALCRSIPLDDLPAERIWGEIEKLLLAAPRPSVGFELALDLGVVDRLFPEMRALVGCPQEPGWHPEGDVWVHTLMVIDGARREIDDLPHAQAVALMMGAVCHDLGKPATTAFVDGRIRSYNHEEAGVAPARSLLDRLNIHTIDGYPVRAQTYGLVANHLKPGMWHKVRNEVGDGAFRRLAQKVDLELLARLARADCAGRTGEFDCSAMEWFLGRARALGVEHRAPPRLLLGRHLLALGVRPGPTMGAILKDVYERQLDGEVTTLDQALAAVHALVEQGRSES
jgi:tRNA nucleotidyltransferase (CCA-adding enzyme)